ncbi:MAG: hypothetical protein WB715_10515 [Roseiarcus sp.]|uniref:hypothetical protein n=1 Tax=Roseiarcus sp. TaxID=1969460 RepID=UPI003C52C716
MTKLRYWRGGFWYWDSGIYWRKSDDEIKKLVADFLYGAKRRAEDKDTGGFRPVPFNPKARDISEVMSAVENEVLLPDGFAAPCWLPDGEAATDWIVCRNGIVNVRTSEFLQHTHTLWAHSALGWDWEPDATCPSFDAYLEGCFPGDPDAHCAATEWLGYCMTADTKADKGMLLLGVARSGKSTFTQLLKELVGPRNVASLSLNSWLRGEFSAHSLIGKRAAVFSMFG